ncbi:MAG TPA: hypothetical protein VEV41_15035, partial [Terriglobales bacterium]|nr:hypothetical protein [Terriglobales bacterium]
MKSAVGKTATILASTAESFREKSSHAQQFVLGLLFLNVDTPLQVSAFLNGDAPGHDVAKDNGRLL